MDLIGLFFLLVSAAVSQMLKRKFALYANTKLLSDLSGAEIAQKMLQEYNLEHVQVTCTSGHLTDHYNPLTKTVNLSEAVYAGRNAAAAAVAAHKCGHAVQHAHGYAFLRFRSAMVPALSVTSRYMPWMIVLGMIMIRTTLIPLQIGVALFTLTTLFSFVNLPVEFDASNRALAWMDNRGVVTSQERQMAKNALWWAAMTYVVAALGSLAQLLHLLSIMDRRRS